MSKMTKQQEKLHAEALALVDLERDLTGDEREFVLENFQEMSTSANSTHGAFFTPSGLARDLTIEIPDYAMRVIDLGAGIGRLSFAAQNYLGHRWNGEPERQFVCVERDPAYVRVGRKVMPEATWIEGDILDLPGMELGRFDCAIGNPPFGSVKRSKDAPGGYKGRRFEYHVIAVAATLADFGVFIIPQTAAPFDYSGKDYYRQNPDREYEKFSAATGITLRANCGIDTDYYRDEWHGVSPATEIVCVDFVTDARPTEAELVASSVAGQQYELEIGGDPR